MATTQLTEYCRSSITMLLQYTTTLLFTSTREREREREEVQ